MHWQPTASLANLKKRADLLIKTRAFFAERNILEVETPLLCHASVTDPFIQSFATEYFSGFGSQPKKYYLQTSPEYCMKRLLAAGSGPIYQICKAFRNYGESGRFHNPEFNMLEWYRPGFNHHDLMNEVDDLLQFILQSKPAEKLSYAELFLKYFDVNPHTTSAEKLKELALKLGTHEIQGIADNDKDAWLQILLMEHVEPQLGKNNHPVFIYDFPASQAALAKIRPGDPAVAERFEVYIEGVELANGFHELADANEQRQRFVKNLAERKKLDYSDMLIDEFFLAALENNFPACAGVAVGLDRLFMLAIRADSIDAIVSFPISRA